MVAVVCRRLGRLRLGDHGAPLPRAPLGCGGIVRRAYVFRLRPTARQHVALAACVDAPQELYNAALQERRDAWAHSKTRINYGGQSAPPPEPRKWPISQRCHTLAIVGAQFGAFRFRWWDE
jgi:Helix-turn-helix domain